MKHGALWYVVTVKSGPLGLGFGCIGRGTRDRAQALRRRCRYGGPLRAVVVSGDSWLHAVARIRLKAERLRSAG